VLVIFLLCFHFGFTQLKGAWLTLNVFFVLSGFLIVRLLVEERARTGHIRFLAFYARRARRLFPALALLLAALLVYGFAFASDQARAPLRWDVLATMGYFMNWRLIAQSNQYFAQFSDPSMLQHAWSLSVEEQFYLVIPALILLLMAVLRTRWALIATLIGLALVSAGWMAVVGVGSDVARSHLYYGTDTRAQSLLMGAALGVWTARLGSSERPNAFSQRQVQVVGLVALAITIAGFVLAVPQTPLMADGGMFALSLAALALVWATADERVGPLQRMLAVPPLAALGRISYGAYLWHWPIGLWLVQLMPDGHTWLRVVIGFVLTIGVATVSYQRIERPIHDRGWQVVIGGVRRARVIAIGVVLSLGLCTVGLGGGTAGAVATPNSTDAAAGNGKAVVTGGPVPDLVAGQPAYDPDAERETVAVYGDSIPFRLAQNYPQASYPGVQLVNLAVSGCDLLPVPYLNPVTGARDASSDDCRSSRTQWPHQLRDTGSQLLLVFASWLLAFPHELDGKARRWGDPAYTKAVTHQLDIVAEGARQTGVDVAVVTSSCLEVSDEAICGAGATAGHPGGRSLFVDGVHFSPWGAAVVWKWLVPQVQQIVQAGR